MMKPIKISDHPNLNGINRTVEIVDILISYSQRKAVLNLEVNHFKDSFLWTELIKTGKIPVSFTTGYVTKDGMPCTVEEPEAINEFDFLFMLLNSEDESRKLFNEIIMSIIIRNDKMGLFNVL